LDFRQVWNSVFDNTEHLQKKKIRYGKDKLSNRLPLTSGFTQAGVQTRLTQSR